MTIIAFDGYRIVADKLGCNNGLGRTVTKIFKIEDPVNGNCIAAFSGYLSVGAQLIEWVRGGEKPENYPKCQDSDEFTHLIVFRKDGFYLYEKECAKMKFEERIFAIGSGRDFAMGVMAFGGNAIDAVEVTSKLSIECGNGYDMFTLDDL